ncbi:hypothetical protein EWM64_g870 [Hericium alpestre]|uniref:Peptidase C14 caspase domain-containing protein n=1 Tax=Hericium alpestre TaxID=135208 RepID=A0A4Z0A9Y7_9AGAM|nr:hypothetical protein EWM64_g870 [Hericium alpestre]
MRQLLISQYQFGDHEIVMMTDDDEKMSGTDLWPTCDNIVKQIEVLVHDAEPHDFFIFHFAGHCSQQEAIDDPTEVDGLNEVLIGCDFRGLVDDAILDACHSGTMLDLELYEADSQPRPLSESKMGSIKGSEVQVEVLQHDASTWQNAKSRYASIKIKMMAIVRFSRAARTQKSRRAKHLFTCGEQCQHTLHSDAVVVSLSACLDHQVTWEDRRDQGAAMTDTLIKILEKDPAITLGDVEQQLRFYFWNVNYPCLRLIVLLPSGPICGLQHASAM